MLGKKDTHYSIFVDSFLNHDYIEEDEEDEIKRLKTHLIFSAFLNQLLRLI